MYWFDIIGAALYAVLATMICSLDAMGPVSKLTSSVPSQAQSARLALYCIRQPLPASTLSVHGLVRYTVQKEVLGALLCSSLRPALVTLLNTEGR